MLKAPSDLGAFNLQTDVPNLRQPSTKSLKYEPKTSWPRHWNAPAMALLEKATDFRRSATRHTGDRSPRAVGAVFISCVGKGPCRRNGRPSPCPERSGADVRATLLHVPGEPSLCQCLRARRAREAMTGPAKMPHDPLEAGAWRGLRALGLGLWTLLQ